MPSVHYTCALLPFGREIYYASAGENTSGVSDRYPAIILKTQSKYDSTQVGRCKLWAVIGYPAGTGTPESDLSAGSKAWHLNFLSPPLLVLLVLLFRPSARIRKRQTAHIGPTDPLDHAEFHPHRRLQRVQHSAAGIHRPRVTAPFS